MLNDQGGASINVENGETSPTLRAQSHQHEPVVCYGVNCSGGSDAQVDSELYGCLTASANSSGNNKAAVAYTLDGRNARVNEEISGTLQAKANGGFSYNCVNPVAYTLKIRGGVNVDSHGRSAGKGALIQEDLSATLAAAQDQTLFQQVIDRGGV